MKKILEIKGLNKSYQDNKVLKNIDLEIEKGDFFALLGHNGAGKTTMIGIVTNLINKDSGKIRIGGINIDKNFSEARKLIGVVPQEFNFDIFETVMNIVVTQAGFYGIKKSVAEEKAEYLLKKLLLWDKRNSTARSLSGGMKRRLMIARALIHSPEFLILDEPTAGVDVELRKSMWDFIKELNQSGTTILLTTHYLEEVEVLCDKVVIINAGEVIENSSLKDLLKKLDKEIYVFDTDKDIKKLPKELRGFDANLINKNSFELSVSKKDSLNKVFSILSEKDINITSFRNKSNRLEQLFISLTGK